MISEKKINQWLDSKLIKRQEKSLKQIRNLLSRALKDINTAERNLRIDEEAVYTFLIYPCFGQEGPSCFFMDIDQMMGASIKQQWNLRAWSWVRNIVR